MEKYNYIWHCPKCGKVILKSRWLLDGFILKCPHCKKMIDGEDILYKNKKVVIKFFKDIEIKVIHS